MGKKKSKEIERSSNGIVKGSGVKYDEILDHRIDDKRHEREKQFKVKEREGIYSPPPSLPPSSLCILII